MKHDVQVNHGITIPEDELEITTSRSGGPGGQHVNKTNTRISVRWNVKNSNVLSPDLKERVLQKLHTRLTTEGDLIIHASQSRSQHENKEKALSLLAQEVRNALHVPKKRKASKIPHTIKEARLRAKKQRSMLKKLRTHKNSSDY
jgi:ribosome-associated protein